MKRYAKIYKVIALVNSYHSLEGSDPGHKKEVANAISFCDDEVYKLTGKTIHQLPCEMDKLIEYLKQ